MLVCAELPDVRVTDARMVYIRKPYAETDAGQRFIELVRNMRWSVQLVD